MKEPEYQVEDACRITWSAATRSGTRKERNDDSWIVFSANASGSHRLQEIGGGSLENQDLVFAVSDGMGGAKAGDLASAMILGRMAALIPETFKAAASGFYPDSISYLERVIKDVNTHINSAAEASESKKGMAATLALAWFSPENMYLANVGDSRIYRCRAGETQQFSKDHNIVWSQLKRGEISEMEYRCHPRRAALYQVVGGGHENVCPHFAAISFQAGDRFLVCSDGLTDGLWERQIGNALQEASSAADCCSKMLDRAFGNAGGDDTTLIVIDIARKDPEG